MSNETVRAYLLGTLSVPDTVAFEEKYFTDPELFRNVKVEESRLIEDYLSGRLSGPANASFERIYPQRRRRFTWQLAGAGLAVAACLVGFGIFVMQRPSALPPTVAKLQIPAAPLFFDVRLSPGVSKGAGPAAIAIPSGIAQVRFTFELPGVTGPLECAASIGLVEASGVPKEIAVRPRLFSTPGANSEAIANFEASLFAAGDYIAEVRGPDGAVLDKYLFRIATAAR